MLPSSPVDWIAFNLLPGLGSIWRTRALARVGDPAEIAYRLSGSKLVACGCRPGSVGKILEARRTLRRDSARELRRCERAGIRLLSLADEGYPAALRELADAPVLLYLRGKLPEPRLRVAVIGSRSPTSYGRRVATGLAGGLAARGVEVVSGGARGVDTCAHHAALEADGRTVAFLGSGLAQPYPASNLALFERVAADGALVSEFPLDEPPVAHNFPRRNRLISGLSAAVVIVEAALRSGTLSTAGHALEQGREVLAIPGPVSSARSQGCHALIQQGAKLVQNIEDILHELSPMYLGGLAPDPGVGQGEGSPDLSDLTGDEAAVLGLLDEVEAVHVDDLAERAPFGISRLQAALLGLDVRGAVEQTPGRYYLLRPRKEP